MLAEKPQKTVLFTTPNLSHYDNCTVGTFLYKSLVLQLGLKLRIFEGMVSEIDSSAIFVVLMPFGGF